MDAAGVGIGCGDCAGAPSGLGTLVIVACACGFDVVLDAGLRIVKCNPAVNNTCSPLIRASGER